MEGAKAALRTLAQLAPKMAPAQAEATRATLMAEKEDLQPYRGLIELVLAHLSEEPEPHVLKVIKEINRDDLAWHNKDRLVAGLGRLGARGKSAVPFLQDLKTTAAWESKKAHAHLALARITGDVDMHVREMVRALGPGERWYDVDMRYAIMVLGDLGPEARAAIPILEDIRRNAGNYYSGNAAITALRKIRGE